jgi:hypothetical protein
MITYTIGENKNAHADAPDPDSDSRTGGGSMFLIASILPLPFAVNHHHWRRFAFV